ncbi:site-2 protease family protein [Candidatus Saccharibacteria bacterium]|nr:site-2 protease family protein [Candidatus Saccharibacteria bacterium]
MNGINATDLIWYLLVILVSLSIHEMMHAYTAFKLGDTTAQEDGRISLNPLVHIDPFMTIVLPFLTLISFGVPVLAAKPVPFNPDRVKYDDFGAAMIAAAGPVTNLALAAVAGILMHVFISNPSILHVLDIFLSLNVALFVFNMIPIPPLDGSRVLYAFAPDSVRAFMEQIEQFGIFLIFGLVLFFQPFVNLLVTLNESIRSFLLRL